MISDANRAHLFPQIWLLLFGLTVFGFFVALDRHYLQLMLEADQSRLLVFIFLVFAGASIQAAWNIFSASQQIEIARNIRKGGYNAADRPGLRSLVGRFVEDMARRNGSCGGLASEGVPIVEIYADRLRSAVDIGWYIVDILIRLGLVGTIVGFILILGTLAGGTNVNAENIQDLLISSSGGMGIALNTTLAGLITATLLGRFVEHLIAQLVLIGDDVFGQEQPA